MYFSVLILLDQLCQQNKLILVDPLFIASFPSLTLALPLLALPFSPLLPNLLLNSSPAPFLRCPARISKLAHSRPTSSQILSFLACPLKRKYIILLPRTSAVWLFLTFLLDHSTVFLQSLSFNQSLSSGSQLKKHFVTSWSVLALVHKVLVWHFCP